MENLEHDVRVRRRWKPLAAVVVVALLLWGLFLFQGDDDTKVTEPVQPQLRLVPAESLLSGQRVIDQTGKQVGSDEVFTPVLLNREQYLCRTSPEGEWRLFDADGRLTPVPIPGEASLVFCAAPSLFVWYDPETESEAYLDLTGEMNLPEGYSLYTSGFSSGELLPVTKNDKCGYANRRGEIVIQPRFDQAFPFSSGLAKVGVDGLYGYIDASGEFVIEPQYEEASTFVGDLATVSSPPGDVEGNRIFIDTTGKQAVPDEYAFCGDFSEGLALVQPVGSDKFGYIDRDGRYVVPPKYEDVGAFGDGLAPVVIDYERGIAGYIDKTGKTRIRFDNALVLEEFIYGLALVGGKDWSAYINTAGEEVWRSDTPLPPQGVQYDPPVFIPAGPTRPLIEPPRVVVPNDVE